MIGNEVLIVGYFRPVRRDRMDHIPVSGPCQLCDRTRPGLALSHPSKNMCLMDEAFVNVSYDSHAFQLSGIGLVHLEERVEYESSCQTNGF